MTRGMCYMYAPIRRVVYMYFYCIAQTKKESFLDDQINLSLSLGQSDGGQPRMPTDGSATRE